VSTKTIEGVVERVVYSNEENAWSVVRLLIRGKGQATVVGNLLGVQPGESLRLTGRWVTDRKYGRQFQAESYLTVKPSTFVGIEKYLGSGLVRGIGATMARRLVKHFGLETLEVIDRAPGRLTEVEGIGPVRAERIREAWDEQREIKDVMIFLQSHGVSTAHAIKIYKLYGAEAIAAVRNDPYRLAREVFGIGFLTADRIARHLGIPADSPQRARAGVLRTLSQATDSGHVYRPRTRLVADAAELLEIAPGVVEEAVAELLAEGELVAVPIPGAGDGEAVYLKPLEVAERGVAELFLALAGAPPRDFEIDVPRALQWFEAREKLELADQQRAALERALTAKVLVLTGGPGTGKTTLVRGIVEILSKKGVRIELAAPTGRAAKRLGEATGREARTVHRLLEWNPHERRFVRGPEEPLACDLLVVDEASMLDVTLTYQILKAMPSPARLILVGDVDQLPSIGAGRVLGDLIDSGALEVVRLTEIFRQARESLIVVNAHRLRDGRPPILHPDDASSDFYFFERDDPEAILATVKTLIEKRVPKSFGLDAMEDIQLLTPMRRGLLGTANLNAELQQLLNPDGREIPQPGHLLRVGDRVMQRRNNYDLEVWNGEIGRVEAYDEVEKHARVHLEGRDVHYDLSQLDELTLAYACSIHKSQGSEYPAVVIPLHTQHYNLLQRNLLYTAVTRGRLLVIVVGSRRALNLAIQNLSSTHRATLLAERLRGEVGNPSPVAGVEAGNG